MGMHIDNRLVKISISPFPRCIWELLRLRSNESSVHQHLYRSEESTSFKMFNAAKAIRLSLNKALLSLFLLPKVEIPALIIAESYCLFKWFSKS